MSGALSVVAFEAELNAIVKEYLDFSGFDKTLSSFQTECTDKGKSIGDSDIKSHPNQKNLQVQHDMMEFFHKGKRNRYFQLWKDNLPLKVRDEDPVAQKLEFYLNIYFAIYPLKFNKGGQTEAEKAMADFKKFIETRGSTLSQTTEFLPFYALPFVPNPRVHPSYKELFSDSWIKDLEIRIEKFLTLALKSTPQPRLFELYRGSESDATGLQGQIHEYQQKLADSERKCLTYIKRYNKVQADYHSLIGITADLVDSLEQSIQGGNVTPDYLQQLCTRLFSSHMKQSVDLTRPGTAGDFLRQSIAPQGDKNIESDDYKPLDYNKIKEDLASSTERKKALILQALRWRITKPPIEMRNKNVNALIQNDILGCTNGGTHRETMLSLLKSTNEMVRQYAARLFNAFASLIAGRTYLAQNPDLLQALMGNLKGTEKESLTKDMVLGALQKLSLRRNLQTAMIDRGVIEWLVVVLEDNDSLSDYTLEYSVALLMNLCLRTSGKRRCTQSAEKTLKVLSDLLGHDNEEIRPYVNGALYSILAMPSIREDAKAMGMEEILKCFIKPDQPDMNRQIEFIIKQLNSNENGDEYESDDEEDEDEEEDQDTMEGDLDKEEIVRPQTGELSGERLLTLKYSTASRAGTSKSRRKVSDTAGQMLQRPVTPSSRRATDQNRPDSRSAAIGETRPAGMDRPPTRSGSRPNTQDGENGRKKSSPINDEVRPSPKSLDKLGPGVNVQEYKTAFGSRPKIPRTPDVSSMKRPSSRGSVGAVPPQPQYSESGPRPSSAGKSAPGSAKKGTPLAGAAENVPMTSAQSPSKNETTKDETTGDNVSHRELSNKTPESTKKQQLGSERTKTPGSVKKDFTGPDSEVSDQPSNQQIPPVDTQLPDASGKKTPSSVRNQMAPDLEGEQNQGISSPGNRSISNTGKKTTTSLKTRTPSPGNKSVNNTGVKSPAPIKENMTGTEQTALSRQGSRKQSLGGVDLGMQSQGKTAGAVDQQTPNGSAAQTPSRRTPSVSRSQASKK